MSTVMEIQVNCPDEDVASRLARTLVAERLVACANLLPGVRSIYRWAGRVEDESEVVLVLKTRAELFEAIVERVVGLHPDEVPAILGHEIGRALEAYAEWVEAETSPPPAA